MKTRKTLFLAATLSLFWQYAGAAPVVTGVTATDTLKGVTGTVDGSGFGTKSPAGPIIWFDGEAGSQPNIEGQITSWTLQGYSRVSSYTAYGDSNNQLVANVGCDSGCGSLSVALEFTKQMSQFYMNKRQYLNFSPSGNVKTFRINSTVGGIDFAQTRVGGGYAFNECNTNQSDRNQSYTFPADIWLGQSYIWTGGNFAQTETGATGRWEYKRNNTVLQISTKMANCQDVHNQVEAAHFFFTEGVDRPAGGSYALVDNIYIDTTSASVWYANSTNFATASVREPQIPLTWSDTSLTYKTNFGNLKSSDTIFLFVMDASSAVSTGFLVQAGSGDTALNPSFFGVTSGSAAVQWTTIGAASYQAAISTASDFSVVLTSGILPLNTTSYSSLNAGATYFFKVKISTEGSYNSSISTRVKSTNLNPSISGVQHNTFDVTVADGGLTYSFVVATDAGFTSIYSSASATGSSQAPNGLSPSTNYWVGVNVATEAVTARQTAATTTSAAPAGGGTGSPGFNMRGTSGSGVTVR